MAKKAQNTTGTEVNLSVVSQIAIIKALEVGYGRFLNADGSPMQVTVGEGYLGCKQFESEVDEDFSPAQPGKADVVRVTGATGDHYRIEFPMMLRPIGTMAMVGKGGTIRTVNGKDLNASEMAKITAAVVNEANRVVDFCRNKGVTQEIAKRIAQNILMSETGIQKSGGWVNKRNYRAGTEIIVQRRDPKSKVVTTFRTVEELASEIHDMLFVEGKNPIITEYKVIATIPTTDGAMCYPSQAMVDPDEVKAIYGEGYGRIFIKDADGTPLMTPQRIGHALRTYDTWTDKKERAEYDDGPLPVSNTSGGLRTIGQGMVSLLTKGKLAQTEEPTNDDFFAAANLIHGGLFTIQKKVEKAEKTKKTTEVPATSEATATTEA